MSSQIDPVTGLPVFTPPPIEEPPFLNPPFPWKDLTGIDVPPRATYYGADGIPTIATVAGMNPQDNRGQTVNTNGEHALLVDDVSGGSGGGVVATKTFETSQLINAPSIKSPLVISRICSFMMVVFLDTPASTTDRSDVYFVCLTPLATTSPRVQLGMVPISVNGDGTNPLHYVAQYDHDFTNPLDPCTMLGLAPGTNLQLRADGISWATGLAYMALHYT